MSSERATYSLRYLQGDRKIAAIKLMRELTHLGLAQCKDIVEQQRVFAEGIEHAAATTIVDRFWTEAGSKIAILDDAEYRYGFDPQHGLRGDQPLIRLRIHGPELAWERGRIGEWTREREQSFEPIAARDQAIATELARWADQGLELAERELDIVRRTSAREPQLEQAIREVEQADEALAVHADWLQRQGDPRGLLAALDLARARTDQPRERERLDHAFLAALTEHRAHLLGPFHGAPEWVRFEWRGGLVVGLHFEPRERASVAWPWPFGDLELVEGLLALPICACLQVLRVSSVGAGGPAFATKLNRSDPALLAGLRELALSSHYEFEGFIDWSRLPRLERLELVCGAMTPIHLPNLRALDLTLWRPETAAAALRESRLPSLRALTLRFDAEAFHGGWPEDAIADSLAGLLALPLVASLATLTLRNASEPWPRWVAQALVDAVGLRSVGQVDLRDVDFEPDARSLLVEGQPGWLRRKSATSAKR